MSVEVMGLVWKCDIPPNWKLVLLAYADHANDDGGSIFPGYERVSTKTSYSRSQVIRVTNELVEAALLDRVKRGGRGRATEFEIDIQALRTLAVTKESQPSQSATQSDGGKVSHLDRETVASDRETVASDTELSSTDATPTVIEPSSITRQETSGALRARDEVWDRFVEVHGEPGSSTERGKYNRAVKILKDAGVTAEEYPSLVAAFGAKYDNRVQPAPMTIATRIGELRHYRDRGPIRAPGQDELDWEDKMRGLGSGSA